MTARTLTLLFWVVFPVLASCAYSGAVKPLDYEVASSKTKIDATVGYRSGSQKVQPVLVSAPFSNYNIRVGEALDQAFVDVLRSRFREVKVGVVDDVDIRIEPIFVPSMRYMDGNGNVAFDLDLQLVATDATGEVSEVFQSKEVLNYSAPGASTFLGVLTGLSLFVLSPITLPLNAQVCGDKAVADLGRSLRGMVESIDQDLNTGRQRLVALAREGPVRVTGETGSTGSIAPSRFDGVLDCVVVVRTRKSVGSGFFLSGNGHIVTNQHVVEDDLQPTIRLRSGATVIGRVVLVDERLDLAVIETGLAKTSWLPLAAAEEIEVGAEVIAVGTPEGLDWSVTRGIVSGSRGVNGQYVQTDAAINHGNSGGPLVSVETGKVFGINTLAARKDLAEGLGFAVSAPEIRRVCARYLSQ